MAYTNNPVFISDVFRSDVFTGVSTDKIQIINTVDKIIYLKDTTVEYHPVDDIYREVRYHRANDESLRVYDMPVEALGNLSKGGGKFTARLALFKNGWLIQPADVTHVLKVTGEQISDAGQAGVAIMSMNSFSPNVNVSIEYSPPDTEIILINTGSGVTAQDKLDIVAGVWVSSNRQLTVASGLTVEQETKLDAIPTNPVLVTDSRLNYLSANASSGSASLSTLQNDKLMSLGTPTEIVTTLMETPIPAAPTANTFGDLIKNKILTIFRFNTYK